MRQFVSPQIVCSGKKKKKKFRSSIYVVDFKPSPTWQKDENKFHTSKVSRPCVWESGPSNEAAFETPTNRQQNYCLLFTDALVVHISHLPANVTFEGLFVIDHMLQIIVLTGKRLATFPARNVHSIAVVIGFRFRFDIRFR